MQDTLTPQWVNRVRDRLAEMERMRDIFESAERSGDMRSTGFKLISIMDAQECRLQLANGGFTHD